jgi:hypothetical protein
LLTLYAAYQNKLNIFQLPTYGTLSFPSISSTAFFIFHIPNLHHVSPHLSSVPQHFIYPCFIRFPLHQHIQLRGFPIKFLQSCFNSFVYSASQILMFVWNLADGSCCAWFVYHNLCWCSSHEIRTSCIDSAQLSRFLLKTERESSLRNVVFYTKKLDNG